MSVTRVCRAAHTRLHASGLLSMSSSSQLIAAPVRSIHSASTLTATSLRAPLRHGFDHTTRWIAPPTFTSLFKQFAKLVHPDMFGGSEEQQKVNQESLQQLNAFVSTLKGKGEGITYPPKQKLHLVFYLKKRTNDEEYYKHIVHQGRQLLDKSFVKAKRAATEQRLNIGERMIQKHLERKVRRHAEVHGQQPPPKSPQRGEIIDQEFHLLPVRLSTNGTLCKHAVAEQFRSMFLRAGVEGSAAEFVWDGDYWKYTPRDPNAPKKEEPKKETAEEE